MFAFFISLHLLILYVNPEMDLVFTYFWFELLIMIEEYLLYLLQKTAVSKNIVYHLRTLKKQ